jgi:hypothetical protein
MIDENTSVASIKQQKDGVNLSPVDTDATLAGLGGEERRKKGKALVLKVDIRMMPLMMLLFKLVTIVSGFIASLTVTCRRLKLPRQKQHRNRTSQYT